MTSKFKIFTLLLGGLLLMVLLWSVTAYTTFRSKPVQTFITQRIADYMSIQLNTRITLRGVDFTLFQTVVLEDLFVQDQQKDTLLYAGNLFVQLNSFSLRQRQVGMRMAGGDRVYLRFYRDKNSEVFNYDFLADAFKGDGSSGPSWDVTLDKVSLHRVRFLYEDGHVSGRFSIQLPAFKGYLKSVDPNRQQLALHSVFLKQPDIRYLKWDTSTSGSYNDTVTAERPDTLPDNPWDLQVGHLHVSGGKFRYDDETHPLASQGFDHNHINVSDIHIKIQKVRMLGDTITGDIRRLQGKERCGLKLVNLQAKAVVSPRQATCTQLDLRTAKSHIKDFFSMQYNGYAAFFDFVEQVRITGHFSHSVVHMEDVAQFAHVFQGVQERALLSGRFSGPVSGFTVSDLNLVTPRQGTVKGWLAFHGLPDVEETFMDFQVDKAAMHTAELQRFIPFVDLTETGRQLEHFTFSGNYTGFYYNFVAFGDFRTALGNGKADLQLDLTRQGEETYRGMLALDDFNLGRLVKQEEMLGRITMQSRLEGKGMTVETAAATLEGNIHKMEVNKYVYHDMEVDGSIRQQFFNGEIKVGDANFDMDFNGKVDFRHDLPEFDFMADVRYVDLQQLNWTEKTYCLRAKLNMQARGNTVDNIEGIIRLDDALISRDTVDVPIRFARLSADRMEGGYKTLTLQSDYMDASLRGHYHWYELPRAFGGFLQNYLTRASHVFEALDWIDTTDVQHAQFHFDMRFKDKGELVNVLYPGLFVSEQSYLSGYFDHSGDSLSFTANIPGLGYNDYRFNDLNAYGDVDRDRLILRAYADNLFHSDSLFIDDPRIRTMVTKDSMMTDFHLGADTGRHHIAAHTLLALTEDDLEIQFKKSDIVVNHKVWTIQQGSPIRLNTQRIYFDNFKLKQADQEITIRGTLGKQPEDSMDIHLAHISLADFAALTGGPEQGLQGELAGSIYLQEIFGDILFDSDLHIPALIVKHDSIGDVRLRIGNRVDREVIAVQGQVRHQNLRTVSLGGTYRHKEDHNSLDITLTSEQFDLQYVEPFVKKYVTDLEGMVSASMHITGSPKAPIVDGVADLADAGLTIDYLQTRYFFSDRIYFEHVDRSDRIRFDQVRLSDRHGNDAILNGTVYHRRLSDFQLDITVDADRFEALRTTEKDNEMYYGNVIATGTVVFEGKADMPTIRVSARSNRGTRLFIPIVSEYDVQQQEFVTFINKQDTTTAPDFKVQTDGVEFICDLEITPEAQVQIMFGGAQGDILRSRGAGNLKLEVERTGDFNMYGAYVIEEGDYSFTFEHVLTKYFKLEKNSSISWSGSPYSGKLDVNAIYNLRTSVNNLMLHAGNQQVIDTVHRRVPVHTRLMMRGELTAPDISFDINIPEEHLNGQMRQALRTIKADEEEMNRQVASLLMLNNFVPPRNRQQTPGQFSAGAANRSVSDFVSGQLSHLSSQVIKDLDMSLNYQTYRGNISNGGTQPGSSSDAMVQREVQLELSKKMLDDRVVVDVGGNFYFGNTAQNESFQNAAADVNVEYLITEDGRVRGRAFNRSINTVLEETSYRQGLGLSYREEFDSMRELWQKVRGKHRKKEKDKEKKEETPEKEGAEGMEGTTEKETKEE